MTSALDSRALRYACQRVESFARVHSGRPDRDKAQATALWLEFLGLDGSLMEELDQWLVRFYPDAKGDIVLGFVLGLFVRQYEHEHPRP